MWNTLKNIGTTHRKKLLVTFSIVALENLLFLIYPVFGGFAVNAVIQGKVWQALTYALLVLLMWLVGAARRRYAHVCPYLQRNRRACDCEAAHTGADAV